jgi:DNA transformation protein and related proteins
VAVSNAFLDMAKELLAPLGPISVRRMFGGASIYCAGILFALVDDDVLYLKADATSKVRFEDEGMKPFTYEGQSGPVSMSYWRVPDRLYDEADEMLEFARIALGVAHKAKDTKRISTTRRRGDNKPATAQKKRVRAPKSRQE